MAERERNGEGRFSSEYPDEAFIDAVREHEPAATMEVAEAVGSSRQTADFRLRRLQDDGQVASKKVGRELVWMLTDDNSP